MRIVQEAIANIIKHAHASEIVISAKLCGTCIKVSITDNGIGFDMNTIKKGRGLKNLQNRASILKAELSIQSDHAQGVQLQLWLPL